VRNVFCAHYRVCLDQAARKNLPDVVCDACSHRNESIGIDETDFTEYRLLLWAIFKPELYRSYRAMEIREALQGKKCSRQTSSTGLAL